MKIRVCNSRAIEIAGGEWKQDWAVGPFHLQFYVQPVEWKPAGGMVFEKAYLACVYCSGNLLHTNRFDTYFEARAEIECLIPLMVERARKAVDSLFAPIE